MTCPIPPDPLDCELSPIGILGVVQTPFTDSGEVDWESSRRLVTASIEAGVDGFLVPALASENAYLSADEKIGLATRVQEIATQSNLPVFWGTGAYRVEDCVAIGRVAKSRGAAGCLVAVPTELYREPDKILDYFESISKEVDVPLMIQDWEPGGTGMSVDLILELFEKVPTFRYLKVETLPAGPKYSAVLQATEGRLHVSGGWAVSQMIEALDRGVHTMIPECAMIPVYHRIDRLHRSGKREEARGLFNRLLPVLAFTNQDLDTSIRFFKKLLVRKGIFMTEATRLESPSFDSWSERTAEELVDYYLEIEGSLNPL